MESQVPSLSSHSPAQPRSQPFLPPSRRGSHWIALQTKHSPGEIGDLAAPHVPSAATASARLGCGQSHRLQSPSSCWLRQGWALLRTGGNRNTNSLLPGFSASRIWPPFAQQGLSLPASQVPRRGWLAFCPPADLLLCCSRNRLMAALTVGGYKRDQGEEISFIRTTWCVLNCVV